MTVKFKPDHLIWWLSVLACIPINRIFPNSTTWIISVGEILHNSQLKHANQLENKRVAVVGFGKSGDGCST